jgi:hypothetical protein
METPEGFKRVSFAVISDNGHRLPAQISCLVCNECQAIVLQNDLQDYIDAHRFWHGRLDELFKRFDEPETELTLVEGEWEERKKQ